MAPVPALPMVETPSIPAKIALRIWRFLKAKESGNVTLNVRDGEIMGAKIEEHVKP